MPQNTLKPFVDGALTPFVCRNENIVCSGRYKCMGYDWLVCVCCEHILSFTEL